MTPDDGSEHSAVEVVRRFVAAINRHDVEALAELMTPDHVFVDGLGREVRGREAMRTAWSGYYDLFPDYEVRIDEALSGGESVGVFGAARGTYAGPGAIEGKSSWTVRAAWKAVVRDGRVDEWRVFADNEPVHRILAGERESGMMVEEIKELYAYNRWANRRLLDAVSRLGSGEYTRELGSSFPSVRDTLVHILSAEWVWLSRWRGRSPAGIPDSWDVSTFDGLRAQWTEVERDQQAFVSDLTEGALGRSIAYRNTSGEPFEQPLGEMLRHVVNHSTYHRGQVVTMLRQLGAEATATDLILFYRGLPAG